MKTRLALLALASFAGTASAATVTWNINGPSTQWNVAANWIGGRVPGTGDLVVIPSGASPSIQGTTAFVAGLFIQPGGNLFVFNSLYVEGGASIQGNMSVVGGRFLHRNDVNLEGQLMLWSGATVSRRSAGAGVMTVRPTGSILIRSDNSSAVTLATALQVQGLLDNQSNQPFMIGQVSADASDGTYVSIETNGTMRFTRGCSVQATVYAGQSAPYLVSSGFINVEGSTSNVVDIAANLPVFNAGVMYVNQPDLHIRNSWDFNTSNGMLMRGSWACLNAGRIFFDNNTFNSVGSQTTVYLYAPGSQLVQLSAAQENFGQITLENGASLPVYPPSGTFANHGTLQLNAGCFLNVGGQFANAADGTVDSWISGPTPSQYGWIHSQTATLAGTLNARVIAGYTPAVGDKLAVVNTTQALYGQFQSVNTMHSPVSFHASYDPMVASLAVGCPADFDADGTVDFFDYDAFVNCFEGNGCPAGKTADFDGDGAVDFFDYDAFVQSFEAGC